MERATPCPLGFMAVLIGVGVGVPLGALSGYFRGWTDLLLQRVTDVLLSFPSILLALGLVAGLGVGLRNVIISVGISSIPAFSRLVRASALSIRELPYVEAARALGVPSWQILLRHVIPNSLAPVIVQATLQLDRHPGRCRAWFPGPWSPATHPRMGHNAERSPQLHLYRRLTRHVPGPGYLPGSPCLQPARRRTARCARPPTERLTERGGPRWDRLSSFYVRMLANCLTLRIRQPGSRG